MADEFRAEINAELREQERAIWTEAAKLLGRSWSSVHNGLINRARRENTTAMSASDLSARGYSSDGYFVAEDAEDACFKGGVETLEQAQKLIKDRECSSGQRAWETAMGMRGYAGSPAQRQDRKDGA